MRPSLKTSFYGALILLILSPFARAEVKLRIYLQDGTLQAGTLINDKGDNFVLLTKEGRIEVPKSKVMFVNGKPLKYWESRPDQNYATEIIPSEIPNPAFVNDKANLPSLVKAPEIQPVTPPKPVVAPVAPAKVQSTTPAVQPVAAVPSASSGRSLAATSASSPNTSSAAAPKEPVTSKAEPAKPAPVPVVAVQEKKPEEVKAPVKSRKKMSRKTVAAVTPPPDVKKTESVNPVGRGRFNREVMGFVHYEKALKLLEEGKKGEAIQELHISTLLDRYNGDAVYLLGELYFKDGVYSKAEKFFSHPTMRKRPEAKDFLAQIQNINATAKKTKETLFVATFVGCLAWIPVVLVARRFRKPKLKVISADELSEPIEAPEPEGEPVVARAPVELEEYKEAVGQNTESPNPLTRKKESLPPPAEVVPILSVYEAPQEPAAEETWTPLLAQAGVSEPAAPEEETVLEPEPVPVAVKTTHRPLHRSKDVIRDGEAISAALQRGHAWAAEANIDSARREYRTVLTLDPDNVDAYLGLGFLAFGQNQVDLAFEYYSRAMDLNSNSADAHYGAGRALLEMQREEEGVEEIRSALRLDPTFEDARMTLTALGKPA